MGCDIHAYIEYRNKDAASAAFAYERQWTDFSGRLTLNRNYEMFGIIAGVRCPFTPVAPLRGLPDDVSWEVAKDAYQFVVDDDKWRDIDKELGRIRRSRAEEEVAKGYARWRTNYGGDERSYITISDWHSHTWLTLEEWRRALERGCDKYRLPGPAYFAALGAMEALAEYGQDVRIVIWFDN